MVTTTEVERLPQEVSISDAQAANEARHEATLMAKQLVAGLVVKSVNHSLEQHNRNQTLNFTLAEHLGKKCVDEAIVSRSAVQAIGELLADFSEDDRSDIQRMIAEDLRQDHAISSYAVRFSDAFKEKYLKIKRPI